MQAFNQPGLWSLLAIIAVLAGVIVFGVWALTRRAKVSAVTSAHPYRRQRTVLVAIDRRRKPAPPPVMTPAEAHRAVEDWRAKNPSIANAWQRSGSTGAAS